MATAEQLIIENLDIWTSAIKANSAAGRGKGNKLELYGIKKLRELILELAVRGVLVPQDPSDEPATELLKKVSAEKAKLLNDGKIKKPKALPAIEDDELPFELPKGWAWARFPEVCSYGPGKTPSTKNPVYWEDAGVGYPWVSIADMTHYETLINTAKYVSKEAAEKVFKSEPVKAGTLLMSFKLTVGKIAKLGIDAFHNEAIISIRPFKGVNEDYIYRFLPSRALAGNTKQAIMGATLNSKSLAKLLIPVPPVEEQARIVAKVDELMALCDQLEHQQETSITAHQTLVQTLLDALTTASERDDFTAAWARIADHFDTLFTTEWSIDQLKQTILQLAVMGKLVPQDPNDEPASELLKKIAAEKAQSVKDGKIKKPKALPPIEDHEKPFELPDGWEWVRFGTLIKSFTNGLYKKASAYSVSGVISLRMYNIQDGVIDFDGVRRVVVTDSELAQYSLEEGDLLINRVNSKELVGKTAIIPVYQEPLLFESMNMRAKPHIEYIDSGYLNIFMKTKMVKNAIALHSKEAIGQASINQGQISSLVTPIPNKVIQGCIVDKVDELMALCNTMKTRLNTAQTTQLQMADAMAEQVVG